MYIISLLTCIYIYIILCIITGRSPLEDAYLWMRSNNHPSVYLSPSGFLLFSSLPLTPGLLFQLLFVCRRGPPLSPLASFLWESSVPPKPQPPVLKLLPFCLPTHWNFK